MLLGRTPAGLPALDTCDPAADATAGICLAHAFLAAAANGVTPGHAPRSGPRVDHIEAARDLMATSPSLHVRCAAAACLVYSGFADADSLALLHHLAQGDYPVGATPNLHTRLLELVSRHFRASGDTYRPLAPEDVTAAQRATLDTALSAPGVLTGSDTAYLRLDVPGTVAAAHRLLGTSSACSTRGPPAACCGSCWRTPCSPAATPSRSR